MTDSFRCSPSPSVLFDQICSYLCNKLNQVFSVNRTLVYAITGKKVRYSVVVGHRLEIIIDHRLASVAAADAIFRL